jgi:hypothetical protein
MEGGMKVPVLKILSLLPSGNTHRYGIRCRTDKKQEEEELILIND